MKQLLVVAAVLVLFGCGSHETTVATGPNGETVTATKNGDQVTYSDNKGNSLTAQGNTVSGHDEKGNSYSMGGSVTEADLGVPFYPDSVEQKNGSAIVDTKDEKDVLSARSTKDDPEKVTDFYKSKVQDPKPSATSMADMKMATLQGKLKDGAEIMITAMRKTGEDTQISVAVKSKKGASK